MSAPDFVLFEEEFKLLEEALRRMPDLALASDAPPPLRASNFISGLEALPVACRR